VIFGFLDMEEKVNPWCGRKGEPPRAIIRNHHGTLVAMVSKKIAINPASVQIVEAQATNEEIKLALHLHMDCMIFEGDSSIIIYALQTTGH
jgi:hypothetical protein